MKKSIFSYLLFSLLCISNITWAAAAAGGAGASAYDGRGGGRRAVGGGSGGGGSGAAAMPVEDMTFTCANAALGAYQDEDAKTVDVAMNLLVHGYMQETPNDRVFIARKESGRRDAKSSAIIACRGTSTISDLMDDYDIGGLASIDVLGRGISAHFSRGSECVSSFAKVFNEEVAGYISSVTARAESITFTGHSMGGALAQFGSVVTHVANPRKKLSVVTFGSTGAFNAPAIRSYDGMVSDHKRYFFDNDPFAKATGPHAGMGIKLKGTGLATHSMLVYYDAVE